MTTNTATRRQCMHTTIHPAHDYTVLDTAYHCPGRDRDDTVPRASAYAQATAYCILRAAGPLKASALHRLMYLCQGWCLGLHDEPLFYDPIEYGPRGLRVPGLFGDEEGTVSVDDLPAASPDTLQGGRQRLIQTIVSSVMAKPAEDRWALTGLDRPWIYSADGQGWDATVVVDLEVVRAHFQEAAGTSESLADGKRWAEENPMWPGPGA